jgi:NodT family efflux transporter outer membrane factor (OMF) lipoprotein
MTVLTILNNFLRSFRINCLRTVRSLLFTLLRQIEGSARAFRGHSLVCKSRFYPAAVIVIFLISGCVKVGPDYVRPPTSVSPNWLEADDNRVKTDPAEYRAWWEVFNDPVLNSIIDRAYRDNLSLKIAGVRVLQARAELGIAVGNIYPQTQQANGSLTFNRLSERAFLGAVSQSGTPQGGRSDGNDDKYSKKQPAGVKFSYWEDQINLNAAWEIDFWGKFRRAIESADASLRMSVADYDSALVTLTADAANNYIQIRTLQKRLDIAKRNVESQQDSVRIAEDKFKGGITTLLDVEQAKSSLFGAQSTIPTLEAQLQQTENALSLLLGLPPSSLEDILAGVSDIPSPPPQVAVGIPADLLRRRPDVRSAELQAVAQCAQIGVAKADLFPAFSLTGTFGFLSTTIGKFKLSDITSWRARQVTAGPSFQWNILNYGQITNNIRLQDAKFQELLITYQNTVLRAQQEVEDSLTGFLRAQENAEYLSLTEDAAKRSLDLAVIQYREGSTDFTTVLTAQQSLLTAQDNMASAKGNISSNLIGLYRALGGGWEIREGQDIVSPEIKEIMAKRTNWGQLLSPSTYMPLSEQGPTIRLPDW